MSKKRTGRGALKVYKSYLFQDKDPIIDAFRTLRSDSGLSMAQVEENGGPAAGTIRNWELGRTRRPMFTTMAAAVIAAGGKGIEFGAKGRPTIKK